MGRKLKKCSERFSDACSTTETDGCCGVIACSYCLLFTPDDPEVDPATGMADFVTTGWTGEIGGSTFTAWWERVSNECQFVVALDGYEIYRTGCYEVSCKDSSGSISLSLGGELGTLAWTKYEPRPLALDTVDGCRVNFCGDCSCTCRKLCVTLRSGVETGFTMIEDSSYDDCEAPTWDGEVTVGYVTKSIHLELARDEYTGGCLLGGTADGEELAWTAVSDCLNLQTQWTLYDGTIVSVICERCGACIPKQYQCDCRADSDGRCKVRGYLVSTDSPCPFTPATGGFDSQIDTSTATSDYPWLPGDCVLKVILFYKRAMTVDCPGTTTSKFLYIVLKKSEGETPFIDNTIVGDHDWYICSGVPGSWHIDYEYDACCVEVAGGDADNQNFLVWIDFPDVDFGDAHYNVVLYNAQTAADNGSCGREEPV